MSKTTARTKGEMKCVIGASMFDLVPGILNLWYNNIYNFNGFQLQLQFLNI